MVVCFFLVSSDASLFLDLSPLERNSLIEEKNTPYDVSTNSEEVTSPVTTKPTSVITTPADSKNAKHSGNKKRESVTSADDIDLTQNTHKRRHSSTSTPSKKTVVSVMIY